MGLQAKRKIHFRLQRLRGAHRRNSRLHDWEAIEENDETPHPRRASHPTRQERHLPNTLARDIYLPDTGWQTLTDRPRHRPRHLRVGPQRACVAVERNDDDVDVAALEHPVHRGPLEIRESRARARVALAPAVQPASRGSMALQKPKHRSHRLRQSPPTVHIDHICKPRHPDRTPENAIPDRRCPRQADGGTGKHESA